MFENLKQFVTPQLQESFHSKFSGEVKVFQYQNKYFIKAGQVHQSGGWADALFKRVIFKFQFSNFKLNNVLILGLAGGTLVKILSKMYPHIKTTAVDIDEVMVDIGRKYFQLNNYKNLKIKIADALQFIQENSEKFDLIIVDIFQGDKMPKEFESKNFLKNVISSLNSGGYVIINRLYFTKSLRIETDRHHTDLQNWQEEVGYKIINFYQNIGNKVLFLEKRDKIKNG
jgi:spermidine synthase